MRVTMETSIRVMIDLTRVLSAFYILTVLISGSLHCDFLGMPLSFNLLNVSVLIFSILNILVSFK